MKGILEMTLDSKDREDYGELYFLISLDLLLLFPYKYLMVPIPRRSPQ